MAFTYFFRDLHTIEHIARHVVPMVTGRHDIRIWDAGCASGQEAYTLAIVLAENMGKFAFKNVTIRATDIDSSSLFAKIIGDGVYPEEQVKRIPPDLLARYFEQLNGGDEYRIIDLIRSRVTYERHDLLSLQPPATGFSLILCKNVLLHFQAQERLEVIRMFHRTLVPGGFFATEQTQAMPEEVSSLFEKVTPDAQLFRKVV